jgi:hypothetical protein
MSIKEKGGASPEDMAIEILAIWDQYRLLWNAQDDLPFFSPQPEFLSLPDFLEIAAAANVSLSELGCNVASVDMAQAEAIALSLPRNAKKNLADMPPPKTSQELEELFDRITARLEAVAWETDRLKELREWANENPEKGTQVFCVMRLMAEYAAGKHRGWRE